ncbi:FHA domain-containing protein [Microbacterium sp. cf046]|uniref:DUF5684 domain-containing protein n=1 Tax=Microbacterium sp. cf046 TaxID=1761803 RepID=UPI0008E8C895|nr:DUF5684 domain-containing protein [Microbacterium sp. cf046]SFR94288.1 FHA domain-containing protein [Microbacterium sp. cf046]
MTIFDDSTATALGTISFLLFVVLYVWTALGLSAVFRKSGEQSWKAWVPVLNLVVLLQLGRLSGWLLVLALIPFIGPLIVWALLIVAYHRINAAFGHGAGMTVLAALLLPVWASVLGFGPARWLGAEPGGRRPATGGPRRTAAPDADASDDADAAYVPRVSAPSYSPTVAAPAEPVGGWTPPPMPPAPLLPQPAAAEPLPVASDADPERYAPPPAASFAPVIGRSTLEPPADPDSGRWGGFDLGAVSEVTSEVTGADSGAPAPISAVPVRPAAEPPAIVPPPPVTRVPPTPAPTPAAEPWAPARSPMSDPDGSAETSGQVSAIVGAPDAGTPRSARSTVSAQHTKSEIPEEPIDETIITRRRRTDWSLILPSGAAVPITAEVVLLGRKPSPDRAYPEAQLIPIDDGTVSKTHARLALRADHWYVTDLGSTNGVLFATLMGTEVEATPGEEVEAGERFYLGDAEVRLQRSAG